MIIKKKPGIFIVLDGVDGAGKTTQVELISKKLESIGESVIVSKEPTDGPWGMKIRQSAFSGRMSPKDELEAFILDRREHVERKIRPALDSGSVVILDRYFYSTISYQGIRDINVEEMEDIVRTEALNPDIAFILDIDPRIAALRIEERDGQPNEFEKLEDQLKIRENFKRLSKHDPILNEINGNRIIEEIHSDIMKKIVETVYRSKRCAKEYGCDDEYYCQFRIQNECEWHNTKEKLLG